MIKNAVEFLKGKKTYIIIGVTFVIGGLEAVGVPVPDYVYGLLIGLGLMAARVGSVKE